MSNSFSALAAAVLTPEEIGVESRLPEESLKILMDGQDLSLVKLQTLIDRPDVTGFRAHQLLKESSRSSIFFELVLGLYIKKFIIKGSREESLRYAVMTLELWIHSLPMADPTEEVRKLLPMLAPVVVTLVNRWPTYRKSAVKLFEDIEEMFGESYNEKSTFPGDSQPPFHFKRGDYIQRELQYQVFPFISREMLKLYRPGGRYSDPNNLRALSTRKYFGHAMAGPAFIWSIADWFSFEDISPFIREPGDDMEKFLLAKGSEKAKARFAVVCREAKAKKLLEIFNLHLKYGEFEFRKNREYLSMSLDEKADFLRPLVERLKYNYEQQLLELFQMWIDDPDWNYRGQPIARLILSLLRNRQLFPYGYDWLFRELMVKLLRRIYDNGIAAAVAANQSFLDLIYEGKAIPKEIVQKTDFRSPALVLAALFRLENYYQMCEKDNEEPKKAMRELYDRVCKRLKDRFDDLLTTCLVDYTTAEACEAIERSQSADNLEIQAIMVGRELSLEQLLSLLRGVKSERAETAPILQAKLAEVISNIKSGTDCLKAALYSAASLGRRVNISLTLVPALERFRDPDLLLDVLPEIIKQGKVHYQAAEAKIFDENNELIRQAILNWLASLLINQDTARQFCRLKVFTEEGGLLNWQWYLCNFPLVDLEEFKSLPTRLDKIAIFRSGATKTRLQAVWNASSLCAESLSIGDTYSLALHEHPEWKKMGLKERLGLFNHDNRTWHDWMLESLAIDFSELWKSEGWTPTAYLEEIKRIDSYHPSRFADLYQR